MNNSKTLANLVDIFYQIHTKVLKHIANKKARTIFTELYVPADSLRPIIRNMPENIITVNSKFSSSSVPANTLSKSIAYISMKRK